MKTLEPGEMQKFNCSRGEVGNQENRRKISLKFEAKQNKWSSRSHCSINTQKLKDFLEKRYPVDLTAPLKNYIKGRTINSANAETG